MYGLFLYTHPYLHMYIHLHVLFYKSGTCTTQDSNHNVSFQLPLGCSVFIHILAPEHLLGPKLLGHKPNRFWLRVVVCCQCWMNAALKGSLSSGELVEVQWASFVMISRLVKHIRKQKMIIHFYTISPNNTYCSATIVFNQVPYDPKSCRPYFSDYLS